MASFVGDLWKKVGELKFNSKTTTSSSFPFIFDEQKPIGTVGPFKIFEGQDFESSDRKEESIFRRITIFSCKEKMNIEAGKRILKSLKTLRHPRMLRYIFSKESENEILVVTEWVEPFKRGRREDLEWQIWGNWSVSSVYDFLKSSTNKEISIDENCGNLWITSSGEVKVALFNENCSIEDFPVAIKLLFPDALKKENLLVQLTETFDHLVTLSLGERVNLIKKLSSLPKDFLKFLVLPELIKSRKLIGGQHEISIEEILFLFVKGKELIGESGVDDFMFLLSDFYCELLGRHATGQPIPLTICLLDQMGCQGICSLVTEKYAQEKIYPLVNVLLGHPVPAVRDASLKALQGLCDKLGSKTIGNDVLRHLARMQGDSEGLLRLKALGVLEGTVWSKIPDTLKAKICGPAVSRALSDTYPPCRRSGLNLLKRGIGLLLPQEIVTKLVPAVAMLLIEGDAGIRMEAFECMEKLILPTLKRAVVNTASASSTVSSGSAASSVTSSSTNSTIPSVNIAKTVIAEDNNIKTTGSNTSISISFQSTRPKAENITEQQNISNESVPKPTSGSKMKLGSIKKIV